MATSSAVDNPAASTAFSRTQSLGLWDAISIIIGIVIGAGVYETAPLIFASVGSPGRRSASGLRGAASLLSAPSVMRSWLPPIRVRVGTMFT